MNLDQSQTGRLREYLDGRLAKLKPTFRAHAEREDPIGLVYPYADRPRDVEVAALLASSLAYGQRKVFVPVVSRLLSEMGPSPYEFVMNDGYMRRFDWFKYRFNSEDDIRCLFYAMKHVITIYGSLESALVVEADSGSPSTVFSSLTSFVALLRGMDFSPCGTPPEGSSGLAYLLPDPHRGGACKRLNMLLRWMFRMDEVDLGLWTGISPDRLIIPLDTHVQSVSLKLGLTTKSGSTWRCAEDITHSLRQLDPTDPLKYDFLLFSLGAWKEL
jgi:uncharacterized protein (TIGR02757 family)